MSRYVLSLEANHKDGWIGRQGLAEALDSYLANLPESFGRPRFVPGLQAKTGSKPGNGKRETQPGVVVPERLSTRTASQYTDSQGQKVKGQFRHRDLLRDGAICVIHRHI